MNGMRLFSGCLCVPWLLLLASPRAYAGFDHELPVDQRGIWARNGQIGLEYGVIAIEVAGSLWIGDDGELGHTFWQTIDASVISGAGAAVLKHATGRPRPYQIDNSKLWFK